ncbi:protein-L-isoaspartate(D-aspartate) O-methyltransferase [Labilibaculum antarcticum]|uniref:Protein-L-isoaspartate O-methyltransferase n=1 Tax=Labilibaculum antarcticum TaxID=1717717 RepID=A0A1Y1CNZ1_9BACT|nr:protein-L-isoaspartate(D-aspartate) O-methyltransferase [Labilibaculum antarcticum]BAX82000.1 protein-L-isoaspartate O-methyltransferase [Labilibaculum antarcticum]
MKVFSLLLLLIFSFGEFSEVANLQEMEFEKLRINMVIDQIMKRGVDDPLVIRAMEKVERHLFVPASLQSFAYQDRPLPIGEGQTISQPYIVAYMSQLLNLNSKSKVLEIGTGSGYQAAILGEICAEVYSIEIVESLQRRAAFVLDSLKYENVKTFCRDGYLGMEDQAPFDGIIVTCSPTEIPEALIAQLAEGGRLVIPVGEKNVKKLVLLKKQNGKISKQNVLPVRFVPMVDEKGKSY